MKSTPSIAQQLTGFSQKTYTFDDLVFLSNGKYLTHYDSNHRFYYFLYLRDGARLYTLYTSRDNIQYISKRKMLRKEIWKVFNIKAQELDQIIYGSELE